MKRYAKPTTELPPKPAAAEPNSELPEFDIEALLAKSGEILRREITNIMSQSSAGKLDAASSRDLVAYIKLLSELKAEKQAELANMSDDDLAAVLNKK
jgi:hypothetical protein